MCEGTGGFFTSIVMRVSGSGEYYVKQGLSLEQKKSVALAIFQEVAGEHEEAQAGYSLFTTSGFSKEDLASDLLGFYAVVEGVTKKDIEDECGALSKDMSAIVWQVNYGEEKKMKAKNRAWPPTANIYEKETCGFCPDENEWPEKFNTIAPARKGQYFRDWYHDDLTDIPFP